MLTLAFWNIQKTTNCENVIDLILDTGVDVIALAEQGFHERQLIGEFYKRTGRLLHSLNLIDSRIRFYSTIEEKMFRKHTDDDKYSVRELRLRGRQSLLLVGVHLPSKLRATVEDQTGFARRVAKEILRIEERATHTRTVVFGDFNMNPFEPGMTAHDSFHAVMDRRIAEQKSRVWKGETSQFFYNPMWKLMGDSSTPALGTHFFRKGGLVEYFWHTLDQVLIRPSLLPFVRDEDVRIVRKLGTNELLNDKSPFIRTEHSDHLPITFKLNL